MKVAGCR